MNLHPMKLVTIVCDAYAQEPVTNLSRDAGTYGWTLFAMEGDGSKGPRPNDIREFANIQQGGGAAGRRGEKVSRTIG